MVEQHHCAHCQPHEQISTVTCSRCGDGVLVTGADDDTGTPPLVLAWLEQHGWDTAADLICGTHREPASGFSLQYPEPDR
ncbi:hypothetical protein [Rhodococcus jostii]|uniref:hypothetical protein n=1 Tax=Rhodococcus jostii TaxID=132919 RepID=UPI0036455533